jgi:hypothetical protein
MRIEYQYDSKDSPIPRTAIIISGTKVRKVWRTLDPFGDKPRESDTMKLVLDPF